MRKYTVRIAYPAYAYVDVNAEDEDEAIEKALEVDSGDNPPNYEIDFCSEPKIALKNKYGSFDEY